jgi:hypothetical protein
VAIPMCFSRGDQGGVAWNLPSTTSSLGGMVQRGPASGHVPMDSSKEVAMSGVVVAPTTGSTEII